MDKHHEVEEKYDVDEDAVVPDLDALPGVTSIERSEHRLEAAYFDTVDRRLAAQRITLRRRTGGPDDGWHLKLPGSRGRHEVRLPLGRATVTVPKRLRDALVAVTGGEALSAVATLRTRRGVAALVGDDGAVLAELADDRVEADVEGRIVSWREWELELVSGQEELLEVADAVLRGAGALPSMSRSKLSRALGPLPTPAEGEAPPRPKDPARVLAAARLREQVAELRHRDPFVRLDLPDGVHKMRVAIRRLRSALATYRPLLDRSVTEPIRGELKWLGGELGAARDAEVLHERLTTRMQDMTDELRGEIAWDEACRAIDGRLTARYDDAHGAAMTALTSPRYEALLASLVALLADPQWSERADESVANAARQRARHDIKRLRGRVAEALDAEDPAERGVLLHEARKAGKRARYAVEPLRRVYGKPARRLTRRLKQVQSVLGDHHDTVAARAFLRELAEAPASSDAGVLVLGMLYDREHGVAVELEERFDEVWRRARKKSARRWLR